MAIQKTILTTTLALLVAPVFAEKGPDYTYLALGDSVAFGMNALLVPPFSYTVPTPNQFIGYPEILAATIPPFEAELNASCPGETSGSFLDIKVTDYGCNSNHYFTPTDYLLPFKTTIGLHAKYTGAQMDFAESILKSNPRISLVTLTIGANDLLLVLPQLQACSTPGCINGVLQPVLASSAANLGKILTRIRALYKRDLVLMQYYSPSPALDGLTIILNDVMTQVAAQLSAQPGFNAIKIADGFTAFQLASAFSNHDSCQAGLLIPLPPGSPSPCDIHPSKTGQSLLAATVLAAK